MSVRFDDAVKLRRAARPIRAVLQRVKRVVVRNTGMFVPNAFGASVEARSASYSTYCH